MTLMPCASARKTTTLKSRRWFPYSEGSTAKIATTGTRMSATSRRSPLRTAHRLAEQSARADEQDRDEQDVGEQLGPGAEVRLHEHVRDAVDQPAESRTERMAERADDDHRERRDGEPDAD